MATHVSPNQSMLLVGTNYILQYYPNEVRGVKFLVVGQFEFLIFPHP
jgi:hypothetical protein